MFILEIEEDFSAAHQLRGYQGKCENLHGHNWRVKLAVSGTDLLPTGMLVDFGDLKKILRAQLSSLDHRFLNELPPFTKINPTSELIAKFLAKQIAPQLPPNVKLHRVTVWESEKCRATFTGDEDA